MFEYAEKVLNNYNDNNYTHYGDNHPKKEGVAYFDKHVQPSGDTCVGEILTHVIILLHRLNDMGLGLLKSYGGQLDLHIRLEIVSWLCSI